VRDGRYEGEAEPDVTPPTLSFRAHWNGRFPGSLATTVSVPGTRRVRVLGHGCGIFGTLHLDTIVNGRSLTRRYISLSVSAADGRDP
jgi:hypothetical protein